MPVSNLDTIPRCRRNSSCICAGQGLQVKNHTEPTKFSRDDYIGSPRSKSFRVQDLVFMTMFKELPKRRWHLSSKLQGCIQTSIPESTEAHFQAFRRKPKETSRLAQQLPAQKACRDLWPSWTRAEKPRFWDTGQKQWYTHKAESSAESLSLFLEPGWMWEFGRHVVFMTPQMY